MKFDPYLPCPGGKPEKVKFCCRDLVPDLARLAQLQSGNQTEAYIRHLDALLAKHPDRTCLRVLRAHEWLNQSNLHAAAELVEPLLNQQPNNPLLLLYSAPHAAARESPAEGLARLYGALAVVTTMPREVLLTTAYGLLEVLADKHLPMAASHLASIITQVAGDQAAEFPLLKEIADDPSTVWHLAMNPLAGDPYPEGDEPWAESYRATKPLRRKLKVFEERSQLEALVAAYPAAQQAWFRLGCVRGILADHAGALEALRKAAALENSLDLAVLAESIAQLLEPNSTLLVRMPSLAWEVREPELLKTHLGTHPCCQSPPAHKQPKGHFYCCLADRPLSGANGPSADGGLPGVLAYLHLFERSERGGPILAARAASPVGAACFPQCIHDLLGTAPGGESWLVAPVDPPEMPVAVEPEFISAVITPASIGCTDMREAMRQTLLRWLKKWQNQPSPHLEGQTPASAASDPRLRIKLLALLLNWEAATARMEIHADELFALARERLGLPQPAPPVVDADLPFVPFALLCYVPIDLQQSLSTAELFHIASHSLHLVALRRLADALENSRHDELLNALYVRCCALVADGTAVLAEQLYWIERMRRAAEQVNADLFPLDLRRIGLLSTMKKWDEALEVTRQAEAYARSQRPPDLRQRLALLQNIAQQLEQAAEGDKSAAASQQIWTPQAEAAPTKSTLWLPGQD